MRLGTRLLVLLAALALSGADGCPLVADTPPTPDGGPTKPAVDIGGVGGAYWLLSFTKELTVTVRVGTQTATRLVSTSTGSVSLLNSKVPVAAFCQRNDTLCPHQVLPTNLAIIQTSKEPHKPLLGFNRQGPLTLFKDEVGLVGSLDGTQLKVPLATSHLPAAKGAYCALFPWSEVEATASASSAGATKADRLQGKVVLTYSAACPNAAGGAVQAGASVVLSMSFTAKRKLGL